MTELTRTITAPDPEAELAAKPDVALAKLLAELAAMQRMNALVAEVWAMAVRDAAKRFRAAVESGLLDGDEQI